MEFINFRVAGHNIEIAGTTLDLHNAVLLRRHAHDIEASCLELMFAGTTWMPAASPSVSGNALDDEVTLIFEEVVYMRLQHSPRYRQPAEAPSLLEFVRFDERYRGVTLGDFVEHDERRDWSRAYYLGFTAGLDLLVEAARVRAQWKRTARGE